ncbi:f-box [Trichoderma arundinaceum]|uniref:F-box n=1 Tax=Trichoderma arundinaceum TaxID=490622 RepID=A0A395NEW5_TRIAR|nr:f-box [Trichoderma arundinaceum]
MLSSQQSSVQIAGEQLERMLGAFDLFVLHDQPGDLDDITRMLDEITASFQSSHVKFKSWSTRRKALNLVRWLRAHNFTGVQNPEKNYRNLRNCLIGQALRHPDHESIPIISAAIFCCVASRLGIDARCCAFPTHVHAIVYPPTGHTLDDDPATALDSTSQRMFLDPYGSDNEIKLSHLHMMLARLGLQEHEELFLAPVPATTMAMRTAQNIRATLARISDLQDHAHPELSQLMHGDNTMNADACLYAASWASLMLTPPNDTTWLERLAKFLRRFPGSWPEDVWMVEKYLWPLYCSVVNPRDGFPRNADTGFGNPWQFWQFVRDADGMAPLVHRRDLCDDPRGPPFQVGQVFRHRRYGWLGAITSWHERGSQQSGLANRIRDESVRLMFSSRPNSSHYSLCFMCITATESEQHVVAPHNIALVSDSSLIKEDMFPLAGKFFKRFDTNTCKFISNIREEFPLD